MSDIDREIAEALRGQEPDEVMRARVLARMSPELDQLAARFGAPRRRARWLPILGIAAAAAAGVIGWIAQRSPDEPAPVAERALLRPYVVAGASSDETATTLLAGRFASLDVGPGELVRATIDRERIGVVGPGQVTVRAATRARLDLELASGTLLVDVTGIARQLHVRVAHREVIATNARFAVQMIEQRAVVFVDRGELELDGRRLAAGAWDGPEEGRSQALVNELREHGNSVAPPSEASGIAAIGGRAAVVTESGAVLGPAPVWARLPAGDVALVAIDDHGHERHTNLNIHDGAVARIAAAQTAAPAPAPAPPAASPAAVAEPAPPSPSPMHVRTPVAVPRTVHAPSPPPAPAVQAPPSPPPPPPSPAVIVSTGSSSPIASTPLEPAAELYARAEAALAARDRARAAELLGEVVASYPSSPQAPIAHYDLANLARARGDVATARSELRQVLAGSPPAALREPASYLDCRLQADAGAGDDAATCFAAFRLAFASSPHDAEVLAWLAGRAFEHDGCAAARPLAAEYVRRYPRGPFAARGKEIAACAP